MGLRGRGLSEPMKNALADMEANQQQTINEVADRHFVSRGHFRELVNSRGYSFKRMRMGKSGRGTRPRTPEQEAVRLSSPAFQPEDPETRAIRELREEIAHRERSSAPAEVRMQEQLRKRFESLARLWGDWIKD